MFRSDDYNFKQIDWISVLLYLLFVMIGWFNIYAVSYDPELDNSIFDFSINSGKQLLWIGGALILIISVLVIDYKFYTAFSYIIYVAALLLLIVTIFAGTDVNGSKSWLDLGFIRVQPAEFAKFGTALVLARYLSEQQFIVNRQQWVVSVILITIPAILILAQKETGVALVFSAFILVMYREGMTSLILLFGVYAAILFVLTLGVGEFPVLIGVGVMYGIILLYFYLNRRRFYKNVFLRQIITTIVFFVLSVGFVKGVHYMFHQFLQEHQRNRIMVLFDTERDLRGKGYHVRQSKVAIGSGDLFGKGYKQGTQTKFDFVPEQSTDFIFCTIGEEHGWVGSTIVIILYSLFMMRLVFLADRQKDKFSRVYGYSVVCIILFHFLVNIGMTIGLFPVIGIPLPFFSYGGSSLWSFTLLLFVFLKLDAQRVHVLAGH